jgi:predicted RNA binding protein YcfA (HicA-like mRNA interferase family)
MERSQGTISGDDMIRALKRLGYVRTRQRGSHVRLETQRNGPHGLTVPLHRELKRGTLQGILDVVARHHGLGVEELRRILHL